MFFKQRVVRGVVGGVTKYFHVVDPEIAPESDMHPQEFHSASLSAFKQILGNRHMRMRFKVPLKGVGPGGVDAAAITEISILLRACWMAETINAGVSSQYDPSSGAVQETIALDQWVGPAGAGLAKNYVLSDAKGNVKYLGVISDIPYLEFEFLGIYTKPADGTQGTPTFDDSESVAVENRDFLIDTYAAKFSSLELDLGNVLEPVVDPNAANGVGRVEIVDRRAVGSFDPEEVLASAYDYHTKWEAGNEGVLTIQHGDVSKNIALIDAPKVQYGVIAPGERSGLLINEIPLLVNRDSGDDEIRFTFK